MEFTFEMRLEMANALSGMLCEAGFEARKAAYVAVVITEDCLWKLKRYGVQVAGDSDEKEAF